MSWVRMGAGATLGAASVLLIFYALYWVWPVLIILIISIIFAQAISPLVIRLRRLGARRSQAVLVIYLVLALALAGLVWLLAQAVVAEAGTFLSGLPSLQQRLLRLASSIPNPQLRQVATGLVATASHSPLPTAGVPGQLLGTAVAIAEVLFSVFSVLVITFYWISERLVIRRTLLRLLLSRHRERGLQIWDDVENKLGAWVRGQLLLMLFVGAAFGIGLTALGVKYSLLLAAFAGLAEIVPLIGPYIGTAPAVVLALTQSPHLAIEVALFGVAVQLVEGNVLVPRVMGRATGVSPLTVILGILVGAKLMGIPGALLAVPVAAAVQVLLVDLNLLGEESTSNQPLQTNGPAGNQPTIPPRYHDPVDESIEAVIR
ncbi:MAG: AI-2E family transporter [Chloroflexota bacterium]